MKTVFFFTTLFFGTIGYAQLNDEFTDGDFTNTPTWSGTAADFIVNASQELQISNTIADTSYLSTPHGLSTLDNQEWSIDVRMPFAPSSSNFGRIYLTSTASDLTTNPDGFFIQLGESGSTDAVRLNKIIGGVVTNICSSPNGGISTTVNLGLRIVRDNAGNWELYIDFMGGTAYGAPILGTDASLILGTHFGVLGTYTVSNATKFYFDKIYVGPEILDTQAPTLVSSSPISNTQIDLLFSEAVTGAATSQSSNYTLSPLVAISSATIDAGNNALVHIVTATPLSNGQTYQINVSSTQDLVGNMASNLMSSFTYLVGEVAQKGDIIITEIMADPTPTYGLPEVEYIEIFNKSSRYIDLTDWKLGDASGDGTIVSGFISPGQYKLLCSSSSQLLYSNAFVVTSFPSYNNSGDDVVLKDTSLQIIDKVVYLDSWYKDEFKKDGGYSLELINPNDPCSDISNWSGSFDQVGGTPLAQNSVFSTVPDTQIPQIISIDPISNNQLEVVFNEGMDSLSLVNGIVTTSPTLSVSSITSLSAFPTFVQITFASNFNPSQLYQFSYTNVADCWMNSTSVLGQFALSEEPVNGDLVINEILFDPATGGDDFIELYNKSNKVLNLKDYTIANYDNDTISNIKVITNNYSLFPGEYVVITADSNYQKSTFPNAISGRFIQMTLPSLNNDSSTIYLQYNGTTIDRVSYKADWHFSLIDETENKTLERIDPNGLSNQASNWHTAAETVGFGTPGFQNSQYQDGEIKGEFGSTSGLFSPDSDGFQDVLQFYYSMKEAGMVATLSIYDDQGRLVKDIFKNELLGIEGTYTWDGTTVNGLKSPIGVYLAVIEAFNIDGTANFSKRIAFTLAGKLN